MIGLLLPILTTIATAEHGIGSYSDWIALRTSDPFVCAKRSHNFFISKRHLVNIKKFGEKVISATDNDYGSHMIFIFSADGSKAMIGSLGLQSMKAAGNLDKALTTMLNDLQQYTDLSL